MRIDLLNAVKRQVIILTSYSDLSKEEQNEIFKEIIKDHYQYPRNHVLCDKPEYYHVHLKNPSCGDDLTVQVSIVDNKITDIRQKGDGCSICCASASMMSEICCGDDIATAEKKIDEFKKMVRGEQYDMEILSEAISLQGVVKVPPRIKCSTLAWLALEKALMQEEKVLSLSTEDGEEFK